MSLHSIWYDIVLGIGWNDWQVKRSNTLTTWNGITTGCFLLHSNSEYIIKSSSQKSHYRKEPYMKSRCELTKISIKYNTRPTWNVIESLRLGTLLETNSAHIIKSSLQQSHHRLQLVSVTTLLPRITGAQAASKSYCCSLIVIASRVNLVSWLPRCSMTSSHFIF